MKVPIYLDYHATTPVDPRVLDAMLPFFTEQFGNASSKNHAFGWTAARAVDKARQQVAALIGAHDRDIIFTSGATESNNLALAGAMAADGRTDPHVITVATEHPSVLDTCRFLETQGCSVTYLPVDADGLVDPAVLASSVTDRTVLVSVMAANNEIGVLQPLAAIGAIAQRRGVLLHVDASQAVGRVPFDVGAPPVDLVSFTAHKIYGPKGIGALYVRKHGKKASVKPLLHGGGQERGLRPGTLDVPSIVGFGRAAEICHNEIGTERERLRALRDALLSGLRGRIPSLRLNGSLEHRLPNNVNVAFPGVNPEALRLAIDDLAVSFGAACSTGSSAPSHVLTALGVPADLAMSSVRFGLGRWTTAEEIEYAVGRMTAIIGSLSVAATRR